jgi:transposase
MSDITLLAIDLAKNTFQLHGLDVKKKAVLKKKINGREKFLESVANLKPCNIYMEACGSSNYWGRKFISFGHSVQLMNPRYVKPYIKRNKNDAKDAEAIAAAALAPSMNFCNVKTESHQDMQSTHRVRSLFIQQRTALTNQIRGLLSEYGIVMAKGNASARKMLPEILGNNPSDMSGSMLLNIKMLYEHFLHLDKQIAICDKNIETQFKGNDMCKKLEKIPGVGVLGATILASMLVSGSSFKNGRHFAAFLGLTPKQHSSGGKERLLGISKGGDTYTRTLLIHGARAVLLWVDKKTDNQSIWLKKLLTRAGKNIAAVALANKIARTAWAVVHDDTEYNPNHKPIIRNRPKAKDLKAA